MSFTEAAHQELERDPRESSRAIHQRSEPWVVATFASDPDLPLNVVV